MNGGGHTIAEINVIDSVLDIHASQKLNALNIGSGGTVVLGELAPGLVPEPSGLALLALSVCWQLGRRARP